MTTPDLDTSCAPIHGNGLPTIVDACRTKRKLGGLWRATATVCLLLTGGMSGTLRGAEEPQYDTTPLKPFPWTPTYPRDYTQETLTPADWVGPDGIIYPNWSWAGVHIGEPGKRVAGIPMIEKIFKTLPKELAGQANGEAFTEALATAIEECGVSGGGVIAIPVGTFVLTRPLMVRSNGIVIRGAGRGKAVEVGGRDDAGETRIKFDFAYGVDGARPVKVLSFPFPERITKDTQLNFYAQAFSPKSSEESHETRGKESHIYGFYVTVTPEGKKPFTLALSRNYNERNDFDRFEHFRPGGPANAIAINGEKLEKYLKDVDRATFDVRVVWKWEEKEGKEKVMKEDSADGGSFTFVTKGFDETLPPSNKNMDKGTTTAAVSFVGDDVTTKDSRAAFTSDAKRGDTVIHVDLPDLETAEKQFFRPGQAVKMWVYSSKSFREAIERDGGASAPRDQEATIAAVRAGKNGGVDIEIEQPLQFDFPKNEGEVDTYNPEIRGYSETGNQSSFMKPLVPIQECGVENLVLEQVQHIWFNGIRFNNAMNCWVKNVRVERAGRDPIAVSGLMNEIRSCEVIDALYSNNTGGGSAYLHGGTLSLIDDVYSRNMRHAPNFTGGTAGVVRNSRFFSSDMQWHQNWGRAHLFENCEVDALKGTGSYGYAAFAQRSITDIHGPGMGPRNVIYNCDLIGPDGGIFLGGKSENPLILFNRVRAWAGPGLILRYHIFNGIFLGNVFAVEDRFEPGVLFGEDRIEDSRLNRTKERRKPLIHPGLGTANVGNDFLFNTVYGGNGHLAQGSWMFDHVRSPWRRSYGNKVLPWEINPPRPKPDMESVFQMQRDHPEGFAHLRPTEVLYNPDAISPVRPIRMNGTMARS